MNQSEETGCLVVHCQIQESGTKQQSLHREERRACHLPSHGITLKPEDLLVSPLLFQETLGIVRQALGVNIRMADKIYKPTDLINVANMY